MTYFVVCLVIFYLLGGISAIAVLWCSRTNIAPSLRPHISRLEWARMTVVIILLSWWAFYVAWEHRRDIEYGYKSIVREYVRSKK